MVTDGSGNTSEFSNYAVATDSDAGGAIPSDLAAIATTGGGLTFNADGGDDIYLLADDGGAILGGRTNFTFELQFATTDLSNAPLVSYATSGNSNSFLLYAVGTDLQIYLNGGLQTASGIDYSTLADGNLQSLAFTWDNTSGDWQVFHDGTLVDSGTGLATGTTFGSGGTLLIGQEQDAVEGGFSAAQTFGGTLHNARFFSQSANGRSD